MKSKEKFVLYASVLVVCAVACIEAELNTVLRNFEVLSHDDFRHHVSKRDLYVKDPDTRQVEYDTLGRHFRLVLRKSTSSLSDDFKVVVVGADNVERIVDMKPAMYHGYLADEPDTSFVNAYFEDENSLLATIRTQNDTFAIEPSWRHLPDASTNSMISYRISDLDMEQDLGKHFCGYIREGPDVNYTSKPDTKDTYEHIGLRNKRSSSCARSKSQPVCTLILVADYRFYQGMGQSNLGKTTNYLIGLIDRVNDIYKVTSFGSCGTGFGFEIKEIKVYEQPTVAGQYGDFNEKKDDWDTSDLLEKFSRDPHYKDFCLSHLFTQIPFSNGVLGLAYIGGSRPYSVGGVCSPSYFKGGFQLYLNTGWSSAVSRSNRLLLTLESTLVTSHELGHNWGSEHDPDTAECSPSSSGGGKYIMYTYSVSGMDNNNKVFSPCSRRSMGAVLEAKADSCFRETSGGFCGNFRIEGTEQCDAGPGSDNPCCTSTCHLKPGAVCSDSNHACCHNCQYAPIGTVCEGRTACTKPSTCTGTSKTCPQAVNETDGKECFQGHCKQGKCQTFCEFNNKFACICDGVDKSCKWCCRDTQDPKNSTCMQFMNKNLPGGSPCLQGYCDNQGVCQKSVFDSKQRLWDLIENLAPNKIVLFMRANIVGTVIILSLILWIPICCIISFIDYKHNKEKKKLKNWKNPDNSDFIDSGHALVTDDKRPLIDIKPASRQYARQARQR